MGLFPVVKVADMVLSSVMLGLVAESETRLQAGDRQEGGGAQEGKGVGRR